VQEKGEGLELEKVLAVWCAERDRRDREREMSPLVRAADAIVVDNTAMDGEEISCAHRPDDRGRSLPVHRRVTTTIASPARTNGDISRSRSRRSRLAHIGQHFLKFEPLAPFLQLALAALARTSGEASRKTLSPRAGNGRPMSRPSMTMRRAHACRRCSATIGAARRAPRQPRTPRARLPSCESNP